MSRSYYVIELSARWLTVLLAGLALLMVLAFGLGYGAARSTAMGESGSAGAEPAHTPLVETEVIPDRTEVAPPPTPSAPAATPTRRPMPPTAVPPTTVPASPTPEPRPTKTPVQGFWVQVLASSSEASIEDARTRLVGLGFDREHQRPVREDDAAGNELIKLRVGPFPDRTSADRVLQRMQAAGFPDAWVVVP